MKFKTIFISLTGLLVLASCGNSVVIEDFEKGLDKWTVEGEAFTGTTQGGDAVGFMGASYLKNADEVAGSLTSAPFTITKPFINLLLGGSRAGGFGNAANGPVRLMVDGEPVRASGSISSDPNTLEWVTWDVKDLVGKEASIRIEVAAPRNMGNFRMPRTSVLVDQIQMGTRRLSTFLDEYAVTLKADKKYILIPAANNGTNSRLSVEVDGVNILGNAQSARPAATDIQYYIPVNVEKYAGKDVTVKLTGIRTTDAVYDAIETSDELRNDPNEPYRPLVHFAPAFGWTNDPNGMVYVNGEWHLSLQYNPYGTTHGNMHWGLSVSKDLIHWQDQPLVIAPDELGSIFSGSAVVDHDNTSGFGKDAVVAIYTSAGAGQRQSIAYSTDNGYTFTKYPGNPVLADPAQRDFRDPKVNWIDDQWVMALACGQVIRFYGSKDLKEWYFLSDFGTGLGSHAGVWECPDLMKFNYNGQEKWVLFVSINPGGPNGGSITQYFVGKFDGKNFKADPLPYPLWVDEGVDDYAGVTFANAPDGRTVFMGWMSNWVYTGSTPTVTFRNGMTLPRDLSLKNNGKHIILASVPSPEVYAARFAERSIAGVSDAADFKIPEILNGNKGAYEIDFTVVPDAKGVFCFTLSNSKDEVTVWKFDLKNNKLELDRSKSGLTDFHQSFAAKPVEVGLNPRAEYKCQLFVDKMSTELFINDGDMVFTNSVFPTEVYNTFGVVTDGCKVAVKDVKIYELK
ncbi:MAG: GH32 C-terminal domain-containing protein [Bacteroidales bacterium]|nr:GH32 C-terminal domain-containing protein [Bacteroidales bacterium]